MPIQARSARKPSQRQATTKYDVGNAGRVGTSGYHNSASRNKNKKVEVPEEMIFMILVFMPADILYNTMRFVCKQWYRIISDPLFIEEHLSRASSVTVPYEVFTGWTSFRKEVPCYDINNGETNVSIAKSINLPFRVMVTSSCDGLIIVHGKTSSRVANPTTKQIMFLPHLNASSMSFHFREDHIYSIAPIISGKKYKVILILLDSQTGYHVFVAPLGRKAKWREIHKGIQCNITDDPDEIFGWPPYATQGFFHWTCEVQRMYVSLDLKTETFHQFLSPAKGRKDVNTAAYHTSKNELYCLLEGEGITEILMLTDPKQGGWSKIYRANYPFWSCGDPFIWLKHGQLICLIDDMEEAHTSTVFNLNTRRKETLNYRLDDNSIRHRSSYFEHVSSLVQLPLS